MRGIARISKRVALKGSSWKMFFKSNSFDYNVQVLLGAPFPKIISDKASVHLGTISVTEKLCLTCYRSFRTDLDMMLMPTAYLDNLMEKLEHSVSNTKSLNGLIVFK